MLRSRCSEVPSSRSWVVDGADWTASRMPAAKTGSLGKKKGGAPCKASAAGLWPEDNRQLLRAQDADGLQQDKTDKTDKQGKEHV